MGEFVNCLASRYAVRLALAGVTVALLAGCSSDVTRFSEDPFSNPFNNASDSADKSPVGAIQQPGGQTYAAAPASAAAIDSQPLPPPVARYSAPAAPNPPLVAQNAGTARSGAETMATSSTASWSAVGGTPIVMAQGETLGVLAARYGVPVDALLRTNGFKSAAEVHPGTRLVIPVYSAAGAPARPQREAEAARPAEPKEKVLPTRNIPGQPAATHAPTGGTLHFVKGPQPAKLGPAAPEKSSQAAAAKVTKKPVAEKAAPAAPRHQVAELSKPASVDTTTTASLPPAAAPVVAAAPAAAAASADANPEFRWPAHGRIIQGFNAGGNDGINIAVPEGTSVKAAEDGVVAYAGDELKGYGKLVLIRHANGFVSAYANNQDIMVKRGDVVKRGQVIAKSGQTGNVASPQLHFELRKGSTPVDPTQYLAGL
jgi:murein DD-endopeptidase MepM/ murein hydrolase activator NlpD